MCTGGSFMHLVLNVAFLLALIFVPGDGGDIILQNVGLLSPDFISQKI
jgi:hypothetical protein